ncbi:MAG: AAA family ATPase [Acidobacteriota bacterium]|nr:AAA family ATPase [Acidobacteriota bacterium]MDH3784817.1 AAA family ATPase [Acidobacteriota bacterium]
MAAASRRTKYRLSADRVRWRCDPKMFSFRTTKELDDKPIQIIGQRRAQDALAVGLAVHGAGYNVFVAGDVGTGRSTIVRRLLNGLSGEDVVNEDMVFVHNFIDPSEPVLLRFPASMGAAFRRAMELLTDRLFEDLPALFESDTYRQQRAAMVEATRDRQKNLLKEFEKHVARYGFTMVQVQIGTQVIPQLVPKIDDDPVEMDELEKRVESGGFDPEEFSRLKERLPVLRAELEALGKTLRNVDRDIRQRLHDLDGRLVDPLLHHAIGEIADLFSDIDGLVSYLEGVHEDLLVHLDGIRRAHEAQGEHEESQLEMTAILTRYRVNVIVDNSQREGPPIIWEKAPSYRNLIGHIDADRVGAGEWESDHTMIRVGSLIRANGGCLVVDAMDLLADPPLWVAVKRTLRHREVTVQPQESQSPFASVSLKPQPVAIRVKVILLGTRQIYRLLSALDEDFKKIFKIKAELSSVTPRSVGELRNYAQFVHKKVGDDGLPEFDRKAVAAIAEHAVRMAGHQEKLTTRFSKIADLIRESGFWARNAGSRVVREKHVDEAVTKQIDRVNLLDDYLKESVARGQQLLTLDGEAVGQINGLAVLDAGDHAFGQPSRITVTTSVGRGGIIDIEREARMSGRTHTKGVLILGGFMRHRFARDRPLTLSASICFEQNYNGIDGDSASSTELYALLSSLSGVPLDQGIAVTGSVNQRGEIQPIGGVNEKIEGYYEVCAQAGLTGRQGVLIPRRNCQHLMLDKAVVAAIRKRRFHVWSVNSIEEGLQVLTGKVAGVRRDDGTFPPKSLYAAVDAELTRLAKIAKEQKA